MCGRFAADLDWGELGLEFDARASPALPGPSWNIRPTQAVGILAQDDRGIRHLAAARWSLIPAWSTTGRLDYPTFNARIETILAKRTWSDSARSMRALIPMTGYYETSADRHPWYFFPQAGGTLLVAGLYSWWRGHLTCTVLTRDACGDAARIHNRMPVLVARGMASDWISPHVSGHDVIPNVIRDSADLSTRLHQHEVRPISGDGARLIEPTTSPGTAHHYRQIRLPRVA